MEGSGVYQLLTLLQNMVPNTYRYLSAHQRPNGMALLLGLGLVYSQMDYPLFASLVYWIKYSLIFILWTIGSMETAPEHLLTNPLNSRCFVGIMVFI